MSWCGEPFTPSQAFLGEILPTVGHCKRARLDGRRSQILGCCLHGDSGGRRRAARLVAVEGRERGGGGI